MEQLQGVTAPPASRQPRYYEKLGQAHDGVFRCKECKRLLTMADIQDTGTCRCGMRKVVEVTSLSTWEWLKIKFGIIDFPYRKEFLAEFEGRRG